MGSVLKSLRELATGLAIVAIAGCGGGGSSDKAPEPDPAPPGNPDTTPMESYPIIKSLYFLGDQYSLDGTTDPVTKVFRLASGSTKVTPLERAHPVEIIRPKVAPRSTNVTYSHAILRENHRFWYLSPDLSNLRELSRFSAVSCEHVPVPDSHPDAVLKRQEKAFFLAHRTFFTGVTRENAGIYTYTAGQDSLCDTEDDQYWAIRLNMSAMDDAEAVSRKVALSRPLLDAGFNLLGYVFAAPGEAIQILDKDGNLIHESNNETNGFATELRQYSGSRSALVIGTHLYLVDNEELVNSGLSSLPTPIQLEAPASADLRIDGEHLYLIDNQVLKGFDLATGALLFDTTGTGYQNFSFGNQIKPHDKVFSSRYLFVLAELSAGKTDLLAVEKSTGHISPLSPEANVASEYLVENNFIFFSQVDGPAATALIYKDNQEGALEPNEKHNQARWYFYPNHRQDGTRYQALLLQAEDSVIDADGFFNAGIFSIHTIDSDGPRQIFRGGAQRQYNLKLHTIADGESDHLLFTAEVRNRDNNNDDPINLFYGIPQRSIGLIGVSRDPGTIICERIDEESFVRNAELCAPEPAEG